jgi:RNA recognition motif-containing protein
MSDESKVTKLSERLCFFFSAANLRQDKWMRLELERAGCVTLDSLLKFKTINAISDDKDLLTRAAKGEDEEYGERLKKLIVINDKEEVRRVEVFDWKTMGDGSKLSLYVKGIPLTEGEERYDVTRDEVKELFEQYGCVGIVNLRFGRKEDGKKGPLGKGVVEFEDEEGISKAVADLVAEPDESGETSNAKDPKTVLELKGSKLTIEKMLPIKIFQKNEKNKRSRDENKSPSKDEIADEEDEVKVEFEPVTIDWEKGCIIALSGLNTDKCDRESIREAVSDILGVSKDVKTSGLYVDYTRGNADGKLRLKDTGKEAEMKELVAKLTDGTVLIADEKVGSAKILEGEEEKQYWKEYIEFLNNRKRQREEEKAQNKKRRFSGGGRGRGRGRGRR